MRKYFQAPWTIKDVLLIILMLGILTILIGIGLYIFSFFNIEEYFKNAKYKGLYAALLFFIQWIFIITPFLIYSFKKYKLLDWEDFGFIKIGVWKTIKLVFSGYFLYLGIILIISLIILFTNIKIPGFQIQEQILPIFGDNLISLIIAGIVIIIIAPILEEIFFRGFILRSLSNKLGILLGSISSAAFFAIFHFQWQSIIPIFILGLIINSLVIRSRSIVPAIFFHAFNNLIAFIFELMILKEIISL